LGCGNSGRIFSHCVSVSSLLVMANPFARQVNHKPMHRANLVLTRF
jgi:tRNA(Leu) C34 or U34 (ribose-2'-O)-methylase TrmL